MADDTTTAEETDDSGAVDPSRPVTPNNPMRKAVLGDIADVEVPEHNFVEGDPDGVTDDDDSNPDGLDDKTNEELRDLLKDKNLSTTGTKAEMVERLRAA